MKIMIFRTFAHTRIWEGIEPYCYYSGPSLSILKRWEPDIMEINLNNAQYGLGIYTSRYFTFVNRFGKKTYSNTIEETKPSLLKLQPAISNASYFMEFQNGMLKCHFNFVRKYDEIDRNAMYEIDEALVDLKKRTAGHRAKGGSYDSLYFSLDSEKVENILERHGVSIP